LAPSFQLNTDTIIEGFLGNAGELAERSSFRAEISNVYRAEPTRTSDLYRVNLLGGLGKNEEE
jgi:hypothetical protein